MAAEAAVPTVGILTANSQSGRSCLEALLPQAAAGTLRLVAVLRTEARAAELREVLAACPSSSSAPPPGLDAVEFRTGADATDPASIVAALRGVDRALIVTPLAENRGELTRVMLRGAKEAGVSVVALVSSWTAAFDHHLFMDEFTAQEQLGAELWPHKFTALRAGWFMPNFRDQASTIKSMHKLFLFFPPNLRWPPVDTDDIGATAAAVLAAGGESEAACRIVNVSGPEAYSCEEIAAMMSEVFGYTVELVSPPLDAAIQNMRETGTPEHIVNFIEALVPFMIDGAIAEPYPDVQELTGRRSTLRAWLERHRDAFV